MMNRPSEYDIRSRALEMAISAHAEIPTASPGLLIQNAKAFATYLRDGVDEDVEAYEAETRNRSTPLTLVTAEVPLEWDPEPRDVGHPEDMWGAPCVDCVHAAGLHTAKDGCQVVPIGQTAPCACPLSPPRATGLKIRIPGETTPLCRCGHGRSLHTGESQHCVALINDGQGCVCRGYEP